MEVTPISTQSNKNVEIERKYIIAAPDEAAMSVIKQSDGFSASDIEQIYITAEDGSNARIRKRQFENACKYYYTVKKDIDGISRFEFEHEISETEYYALRDKIKKGTRPINKTRICFLYEEQLFELDIYRFDESFCTLEIELQNEEQNVLLPPFLTVIKDATYDKSYSNFALAHKISVESYT